MADTIELLESIGRNASLRYPSSTESLGHELDRMQAGEQLKQAALTGDASQLKMELNAGEPEGIHSPPSGPSQPGKEKTPPPPPPPPEKD